MKDIYMIKNEANGKIYVGQSKDYLKRFKGHIKSCKRKDINRSKNKLYLEMEEYGIENFSLKLLETCEDSIANERESYWIVKLNSVDKGYNKSHYAITAQDPKYKKQSGENLRKAAIGKRKKVRQFDKEGNFIAEFEGVREAGRITGISHHTIQKVAHGDKHRKTGGGFIWKYSEEVNVETIEKQL